MWSASKAGMPIVYRCASKTKFAGEQTLSTATYLVCVDEKPVVTTGTKKEMVREDVLERKLDFVMHVWAELGETSA